MLRPMVDLALTYNSNGSVDLAAEGGLIVVNRDLEAAVVMSLFSDSRALLSDVLPTAKANGIFQDRRGWWGDGLNQDGRQTGSRLWLLFREKLTAEALRRAEAYATESLKWLLDEGVASAVAVTASRLSDNPATADLGEGLALHVVISRPGRSQESMVFNKTWEALSDAA